MDMTFRDFIRMHKITNLPLGSGSSITPDVRTLFVKASRVYRTDEFTELMKELSIVKPKVYEKLMDNDVRKWSRHIVQFDDMI